MQARLETGTISEYIKRRFRDLLLNMVVAYAVLQALSLCIQRWPKAFAAAPWIFAAAAPILLMVMAWNGVKLMRISCPRCLVPLGGIALAGAIGKKIQHCPHCHVSLDESK